jgi:hypothetical protein
LNGLFALLLSALVLLLRKGYATPSLLALRSNSLLLFFCFAKKQSKACNCLLHRLYFASLRYTSGVLCGGDAMRSKANLGGA